MKNKFEEDIDVIIHRGSPTGCRRLDRVVRVLEEVCYSDGWTIPGVPYEALGAVMNEIELAMDEIGGTHEK